MVLPRFTMVKKTYITITIFSFLTILTIYGFIFPQSIISKLMTYYNSIGTAVIMILTIAYVMTTSRQLDTMKKQLDEMIDNKNFQLQPLPVPNIKNIYLEKIKAYKSPYTKFEEIEILYRFKVFLEFKNAGTGAALNISAFPIIDVNKNLLTTLRKQIHCVTENDPMELHFTILDKNYEILKSISAKKVTLRLSIYYKNIFGAGFHQNVEYMLSIPEEESTKADKWQKFLFQDINSYEMDFKRHKALASSVPDDAKSIFKKVLVEIQDLFTEDLFLAYLIKPSSFSVQLGDFNSLIDKAEYEHDNLLSEIDPFYKKFLLLKEKNKTAKA